MLTTCPECRQRISDKAERCVKCGYSIAFPEFYVQTASLGLDLAWLLMDYVELVGAGESCYGGGGTREVAVLLNNYDQATREATKRQGWLIIERAQKRLTRLSEKSEERSQLVLLIGYVQAVRFVAVERSKSNLEGVISRLEKLRTQCTRAADAEMFGVAIADLRPAVESAGVAADERNVGRPSPTRAGARSRRTPPGLSSFTLGCLTYVIPGVAAVWVKVSRVGWDTVFYGEIGAALIWPIAYLPAACISALEYRERFAASAFIDGVHRGLLICGVLWAVALARRYFDA